MDLALYLTNPTGPEWANFRAHFPGCTECASELARATTLEEQLRSLAPPEERHLSDDAVMAFLDTPSSLETDTLRTLETHMAGCRRCRDRVEAVRRFDFDAVDSALASQTSGGKSWRETIRPWFEIPALRPAWVALLILLVVVPLLWSLSRGGPLDSPTTVAQTAAEPPHEIPAREPHPSRTQPADSAPPHPDEPVREIQIAALDLTSPLRYSPGAEFAAQPGGRFEILPRSGGPTAPSIQPLAPKHPGRTQDASPALFWYLDAGTPQTVLFQLIDVEADDQLLEVRLPGPHRKGLHSIALTKHRTRLIPGRTYRWYVSVLASETPGPGDRIAGALIVRRETPIDTEPDASHPLSRARRTAEAGNWYDAFSSITEAIGEHPELRERRAELLEQVGLKALAAADRSGAL